MFTQTWKKYLPVIVFLMKRSAKGEQMLEMNQTDFERAMAGRKIKLSFSNLTVTNGRTDYNASHPALVNDFILVLQESKPAGVLMQYQQFNFSMNSNFQLSISSSTQSIGEL